MSIPLVLVLPLDHHLTYASRPRTTDRVRVRVNSVQPSSMLEIQTMNDLNTAAAWRLVVFSVYIIAVLHAHLVA